MNRLFMAMSALLFLAACNTVEKDVNIPEKGDTDKKEIILTATSLSDTKTVLDNNYTSVLWKPADEIKVFSAGEDSKFTSLNTEESNIAQFRGTISVITGVSEGVGYDTNIYGLYPYDADATLSNGVITTTLPSTQTAVADSFDDDLFITIGKSETLSMGFFNVCSGLRFSFSEGGFTSVILCSNNGEALAGTFSVGFDNNGKPAIQSVDSPSTNITVNAPSGGFMANTWYYVICLPGTISGGITLLASTESAAGKYTLNSSLTFTRGLFKQVANLDSRLIPTPLPEIVDMGLSVKWASRNIGADSPTDFGDYYAWGETETYYSSMNPLVWREGKESGYDYASYKWCEGTARSLTKYNSNSSYGYVDNKKILDIYDDVAHVKLGGKWRMPTREEWKELIDNCTQTCATQNGVIGTLLTSDSNGNSIFLPNAGYWNKLSYTCVNQYYYWSSKQYSSDVAWCCSFWNEKGESTAIPYNKYYYRHSGLPVRPVYAE